jgi:hypothetical protein
VDADVEWANAAEFFIAVVWEVKPAAVSGGGDRFTTVFLGSFGPMSVLYQFVVMGIR